MIQSPRLGARGKDGNGSGSLLKLGILEVFILGCPSSDKNLVEGQFDPWSLRYTSSNSMDAATVQRVDNNRLRNLLSQMSQYDRDTCIQSATSYEPPTPDAPNVLILDPSYAFSQPKTRTSVLGTSWSSIPVILRASYESLTTWRDFVIYRKAPARFSGVLEGAPF